MTAIQIQVTVKALSDAELLNREFVSSDPEALPGFVRQPDPEWGMPDIEFAYDVHPGKGNERPYVWCAHCEEPTHWKGFVVTWPDGTRSTVGHDCGAKFYGVDFTVAQNTFSAQRVRQNWLKRYLVMKEQFLPLLRALGVLRDDPLFDLFRTARGTLCQMNQLEKLLLAALNDEGVLYIEERVRDYAAELRRAGPDDDERKAESPRKKEKKKDRPIWVIQRKPVGRMSGQRFVQSRGDLFGRVARAHEALKTIWKEIDRKPTEAFRGATAFRGLFDRIESALVELDWVREACLALDSFMTPANLDVIAKWAEECTGRRGHFKMSGPVLLCDSTLFGEIELTRPPTWQQPDFSSVDAIRRAMA